RFRPAPAGQPCSVAHSTAAFAALRYASRLRPPAASSRACALLRRPVARKNLRGAAERAPESLVESGKARAPLLRRPARGEAPVADPAGHRLVPAHAAGEHEIRADAPGSRRE